MDRSEGIHNNQLIVACPTKLQRRIYHNLQLATQNRTDPKRAKRAKEILKSLNNEPIESAPKPKEQPSVSMAPASPTVQVVPKDKNGWCYRLKKWCKEKIGKLIPTFLKNKSRINSKPKKSTQKAS